jgi:hypothetical protein
MGKQVESKVTEPLDCFSQARLGQGFSSHTDEPKSVSTF